MKKILVPVLMVSVFIASGCDPFQQTTQTNSGVPTTSQEIASQQNGGDQNAPVMCTMEYRYGLTLRVKDVKGNSIKDAKITVVKQDNPTSEGSEFTQFASDGSYAGLGEGKGNYTVQIEAEGFETQQISVNLEHDQCHVHPQSLDIVMVAKAV